MGYVGQIIYFTAWFALCVCFTILTIINLNWKETPLCQGLFIILILGFLQTSVCEFIVMSVAVIITRCKRFKLAGEGSHLSCIINYNLLAMSKSDIEAAFHTMFEAHMNNLGANIVSVLVSATEVETLRKYELATCGEYRAKIYNVLLVEGYAVVNAEFASVQTWRLYNFWLKQHQSGELTLETLPALCNAYAKKFMCIHRVSKVLRKCGQYQDLMLLSAGDNAAWSYTDSDLYGNLARPYNEALFRPSDDVTSIQGQNFQFTMVLDGDTILPAGAIQDLLDIAAVYPQVAILQPCIRLQTSDDDTLYMQLENIRLQIIAPITEALSIVLEQCSFYGKGFVNNELYIKEIIGTRDQPVERVPINILSHDTFEAAALKPMYVPNVALYETPSFNYVTWHIRELRWNKGEILLAMHFWPRLIGYPMSLLQRCFQGENWSRVSVRVPTQSDFVTTYITNNAIRVLLMKPMLLAFILLHVGAEFHHPYHAIGFVMFFVAIFPKLAVIRIENAIPCIIDLLSSVVQYTPEPVVGCVRLIRAVYSTVACKSKWTPQRVVEEEFRSSNPFLSSFKYLWGYSFISGVGIILVAMFQSKYFFILCLLVSVFTLPLFTGLTSLARSSHKRSTSNPNRMEEESAVVEPLI